MKRLHAFALAMCTLLVVPAQAGIMLVQPYLTFGGVAGGAVAAPTLTGSPTLIASWDFGDSGKVTLASGKVSAISGSDGTSYTLAQATASLRPEAVTAGNYGAAKFTRGQVLALASGLGRSTTDSITVVVVGEQLQEDAQGALFSLSWGAGSGRYNRHKLDLIGTMAGVSPSGIRMMQSGNGASEWVSMGSPLPMGRHLIVGAGSPSTGSNRVYRDSTSTTAAAASTFGPAGDSMFVAPTATALGADQDGDYCSCLVWRVLVYAGQISTTNITELAAWMASRWGAPTTTGTLTTADVRWAAPQDTTGVDGYKLYWSTTPAGTDNSATISGVGTLQSTVTGLTTGTWYFTLRSTASGVEGPDIYIKEQTVH